MPEIVIGARAVAYDVAHSTRAARKRIEVTPAGVRVVVPEGSSAGEVEAFVHSKRRWLHDRTEEVREAVERLRAGTPEGLHSGAKVLFRGRFLRVRIEAAAVDRPELIYRTAFHFIIPLDVPSAQHQSITRDLLRRWVEERLLEDAWEIVRRRGDPHDLRPRGIRVRDQRTLWGSCGRDRVVRLDRKLARVPKPVFEYVVVHELCHLEHRDHAAEFWDLVKRVLPDYRERKEWLEGHEVEVG